MVLVNLLIYGWDLWEILDNHALRETQALHQCLTQSLKGAAAIS
jgi:hypothetical protein